MQCFCRVYFHRSISRIPDSGNNHQRHKQPCQGKSRQEASGIERHLAHIHQFGITDIESDDSRRYGRQRKQQHPSYMRQEKIPRRELPSASRNATSLRRCCVRNQNVPITPKKIFNSRKPSTQSCVFHSFISSSSQISRKWLKGVMSSRYRLPT